MDTVNSPKPGLVFCGISSIHIPCDYYDEVVIIEFYIIIQHDSCLLNGGVYLFPLLMQSIHAGCLVPAPMPLARAGLRSW